MNISLTRPLPGDRGSVSQWFGEHPDWYARWGLAGHNGIDYATPEGTAVLATHDGICHLADDPDGYGIYVLVQGKHWKTLYAHLQSAVIVENQGVTAGQQIGWSGNTGNSTGPHLHFGLSVTGMRNPAYGGYIDPKPFRDL